MPQSQTLPVHATIARALAQLGTKTLFGLMGDSNLFMVHAFVNAEGGRFVPATHEANAVLMALGHAAMTGEVGAATVTQGPAVSNTVTALIEGVKSSLPVVLLAGDTPRQDPDHPQRVPQRTLAEAAGAGFVALRGPEWVGEDLAEAFRRARAERRPVLFDMPTRMMWEEAPVPEVRPAPLPDPAAPADGPELEKAVGIIAAARRPIVLAGRGAVGAREELARLARRIGAPLATTLKAKGLFTGEPFDLGVFGTLSTPAAVEVIGKADCILSFGASLGRFTTVRGAYLEGRRLVQVDDDPRQIARNARPDAALCCDPGQAAARLLHWLDAAEIPSTQATDDLDPEALRAPPPLPTARNRPGTVDFARALVRIDAALPPDRVFVTDGGRFLQECWTRISVSHPRNMLLTIGVGAIGMGMGHALGAAIARPGQRVLFVTGDGGFMLSGLQELASVARERPDMVILLCNDRAYGAEYVQFEDRQMDPGLSQFDWPPLADVARAMGIEAATVDNEEGLEATAAALARRPRGAGPILVELVLDPAAITRLHLF